MFILLYIDFGKPQNQAADSLTLFYNIPIKLFWEKQMVIWQICLALLSSWLSLFDFMWTRWIVSLSLLDQ